jgi:hypothetical protein
LTAFAKISTPLSILALASVPNLITFDIFSPFLISNLFSF